MGKTKRTAAGSPRALRARKKDAKKKIIPDDEVERMTAAAARDLQKKQSANALTATKAIEALGLEHPGMDIVFFAVSASRSYFYTRFIGNHAGQAAVGTALTLAILKCLSQANGLTDDARRMYENPKLKDAVSSALGDLLATAMQRGLIGSQQARQLTQLWSDMQKAKRGEVTTIRTVHVLLSRA